MTLPRVRTAMTVPTQGTERTRRFVSFLRAYCFMYGFTAISILSSKLEAVGRPSAPLVFFFVRNEIRANLQHHQERERRNRSLQQQDNPAPENHRELHHQDTAVRRRHECLR